MTQPGQLIYLLWWEAVQLEVHVRSLMGALHQQQPLDSGTGQGPGGAAVSLDGVPGPWPEGRAAEREWAVAYA